MDLTSNTVTGHFGDPVSAEVWENRMWFLTLGIALVVLGIAAIVLPLAATLATPTLLGTVLLGSGAMQILHALRASKWKGFLLSLTGGVVAFGVGVVMHAYPFEGILSLNFLTASFLTAIGVLRIVLALQLRPADHWSWLLGSGIAALILAAVILPQWPLGAAWIFGLLVGIDLLFAGWASIMLAGAARRTALPATAAAA